MLGTSETELTAYLIKEARIGVPPGYPFFGPDGRDHIRIAYTVPVPTIKEALKRLTRTVSHLHGE